MIVYAATDDYLNWIGTPPDSDPAPVPPGNLAALLRSASIRVARACNLSLYRDAPTGDDATVLRDATCAQAVSWVTLGVDPAKAGTDLPGPVKSSSILDGTVQRDTTAATKATVNSVDGLCSDAVDLLTDGGLLYVPGPLFDGSGALPSWGLPPVPASALLPYASEQWAQAWTQGGGVVLDDSDLDGWPFL